MMAVYTAIDQRLKAVREGEEGVGRGDRTFRRDRRPAGKREPHRINSIDLTHSDADRRTAGREQDRVGLHRP